MIRLKAKHQDSLRQSALLVFTSLVLIYQEVVTQFCKELVKSSAETVCSDQVRSGLLLDLIVLIRSIPGLRRHRVQARA